MKTARISCLAHPLPREGCLGCDVIRLGPPTPEEWELRGTPSFNHILAYRKRTGAGLREAVQAFRQFAPERK